MKYLSVCSGVEAATVAWHPLGWEPVAFSEIEKFPSQVLQHHYPTVPNMGDMTKYKEWNLGAIDLLVGGTPCQSFSVAGLRKGLDDPRGNLALVYCGILDHYRPQWFVWENVPGVLSSNGGRDFGSFLGALAQLRYGFAYRVLDAQYWGVAQRRKRVFVVGHLGDWRPAAAVLFESKSLSRDTAPSREKRKDTTNCAGTLTANCGGLNRPAGNANELDFCIAQCLTTETGQRYDPETETIIPYDLHQVTAPVNRQARSPGDPCHTLAKQNAHNAGIVQPIPLNSMNCFRSPNAAPSTGCGVGEEGEAMFTVTKTNHHAVAQPVAPALTASNNPSRSPQSSEVTQQVAAVHAASMAVRRLTPVECERLQGFPDNYTNIKENCPDGPRYKAMGNSMAVPVMRWIGERIALYSQP